MTRRVLFVDDDAAVREALAQTLVQERSSLYRRLRA